MAVVNIDQFNQPYLLTNSGRATNKPGLDLFFKKYQLPYIGETDIGRWVTDSDMRKLERAMVNDNYVHRHQCYWKESVAFSLGYLTISVIFCLLYTSPSPRDRQKSRMPSSA